MDGWDPLHPDEPHAPADGSEGVVVGDDTGSLPAYRDPIHEGVPMSENLRKALYALIPAVVAVLTAYGVITDSLAVLWASVATIAVGFAYAASRATGNRFLDPEVRRGLYVLAPAVVALVGGYVALDVGLWSSLAVAILGAGLAIGNVDPDVPVYDPRYDIEGELDEDDAA